MIEGLHWEPINFKTAHSFKDIKIHTLGNKETLPEVLYNHYSTLQSESDLSLCIKAHTHAHTQLSLSLSLSVTAASSVPIFVIYWNSSAFCELFFCPVTLYYKYYWFIMWSRVLLQKLTGPQLFKKFSAFLWNLDVNCLIHNNPPLSLLWARWIQSTPTSLFLKIHYNIMFSSAPRASEWSHSFRFPNETPVGTSPFSIRVTYPAHLIFILQVFWMS